MKRSLAGEVVLFRVAAGPRVGFGHLVRAVSLSQALGMKAVLSIRGGKDARAVAGRLGASAVTGRSPRRVLHDTSAALLVVDDRAAAQTAAWRREARRLGLPIVSVHDLGMGLGDADLVIDASLRRRHRPAAPALLGPDYAILRPSLSRLRARRRPRGAAATVLVALGGGPRRRVAYRLARMIAERNPGATVGVAGGFLAVEQGASVRITSVAPGRFDRALASSDVVVSGGGVTLFEACSLGVPAVAVAVVPSQRPTISAFVERGAVFDGGLLPGRSSARALADVAANVTRLVGDAALRSALGRAGARLVDGRGAARCAAAIRRLLVTGGRRA